MNSPSTFHALRRTSPKGQKFIGICTQCGTPNLTWDDLKNSKCPNQRQQTVEDAIIEAVKGTTP